MISIQKPDSRLEPEVRGVGQVLKKCFLFFFLGGLENSFFVGDALLLFCLRFIFDPKLQLRSVVKTVLVTTFKTSTATLATATATTMTTATTTSTLMPIQASQPAWNRKIRRRMTKQVRFELGIEDFSERILKYCQK